MSMTEIRLRALAYRKRVPVLRRSTVSEPIAIYLGGPHHGKTAPVRGHTRVALQVGPEGEKRVVYVLHCLMNCANDLRWYRTYAYRLRRPDGTLEPVEGHEELLGEHASKHGVQFVNPRVQ